MSIPYIRPSKSLTVNTEFFITECLQPRLLPFIHNHQSDLNFQFVHDLAGALSSKETIALMKENLPFGNNTTNHQNVPQDRLIENLRGILVHEIYEGGWKATMQQELISCILLQLKNFDSIFLHSFMGGVRTNCVP